MDENELVTNLEENQSTSGDLGRELAESLEDTGYTPQEQIGALVVAIKLAAGHDETLLDFAIDELSQ